MRSSRPLSHYPHPRAPDAPRASTHKRPLCWRLPALARDQATARARAREAEGALGRGRGGDDTDVLGLLSKAYSCSTAPQFSHTNFPAQTLSPEDGASCPGGAAGEREGREFVCLFVSLCVCVSGGAARDGSPSQSRVTAVQRRCSGGSTAMASKGCECLWAASGFSRLWAIAKEVPGLRRRSAGARRGKGWTAASDPRQSVCCGELRSPGGPVRRAGLG